MRLESFYYPSLTTLPDAWKRGSFTGIGVFWIASNNSLTPTAYKIRKLQDQGSIKTSITDSGIDLFDRQIKTGANANKLLSGVILGIKRMIALIGVFTFIAPLGCIWHSGNCIYQTGLWAKGEKQIYLKEHACSLIYDFIWGVAPTFISCITLQYLSVIPFFSFGVLIPEVMTAMIMCELGIVTLLVGLSADVLEIIIGGAVAHSIYLKEEFGLVGKDGWILTFNYQNDAPTINEVEKTNRVMLSGYFCDLWEEQAINVLLEFRKIIDLLQLELKEEELKRFSENPERFLPYLDNLMSESNEKVSCNRGQLDGSIAKAKQFLENVETIKRYLSKILPNNIRLTPFLFSPEICQMYFTYQYQENSTTQQLHNHFDDSLVKIKESDLPEGGPSKDFITFKQNILNANNAYEVLGLTADASKERCRKAYIKRVVQIHPDKTPEIWQAQATELFKVMDAAYKVTYQN